MPSDTVRRVEYQPGTLAAARSLVHAMHAVQCPADEIRRVAFEMISLGVISTRIPPPADASV